MKQTIFKYSSFLPRRRVPLRMTPLPPRSRWIRRESAKRRRDRDIWKEITRAVIAAVNGMCQAGIPGVCQTWATDGHHMLPQGQGGPDTRENCLPVCRSCHDYIETHREWAYEHKSLIQAARRIQRIPRN